MTTEIPDGFRKATYLDLFNKRGNREYLVHGHIFYSLRKDGSWEGFPYTATTETNGRKLLNQVRFGRIFMAANHFKIDG